MKSNIKVSIQGNTCIGCIREEKDIMISLDGKDEKGNFVFLDAFLILDISSLIFLKCINRI